MIHLQNNRSGLIIISHLIVFFLMGNFFSYSQVGQLLPAWSEGYLDIHHINTGKGESAFFILPDGTTMLVDAGATSRPKPRVTDPKPDDSRTPGEWIARYILHMMENNKEKKLDYILLTHFHDDHMGSPSRGSKISKNGGYLMSGITEVGDMIPFKKYVDRGWPDYNWPDPLSQRFTDNYLKFLKWHIDNNKTKVEQFKVGHNDQFVLLNEPGKYPDFEIRNIAANGQIWTGVGSNSRNHIPPLASLDSSLFPGENMISIAFRLSYGKFDYFNGGDITTGAPGTWQDIETPVGLVTGPVDVCLANHHAYYDAMGNSFLQAVRPRIHIIQAWSPSHPSPSVLARMMSEWTYPGPRDVFSTNTMKETVVVIGDRMDKMKSQQGHIVIRVNPGGESYMIYLLDDSEENFKIIAVHGPYESY